MTIYELNMYLYYKKIVDKVKHSHYAGYQSINTDRPINFMQVSTNGHTFKIDFKKGTIIKIR